MINKSLWIRCGARSSRVRRAAAGTGLLAAVAAVGCSDRASFDAAAVAAHPLLAKAPSGFLLGAASSAHQIEGGNQNDWMEWERGSYPDGTPHVAGRASAARAAGAWRLWRDDVAALRDLGANAYRIGLEWSRLEPSEGHWDEVAVTRYREMLQALREADIEPVVTLWHFTLPPWLAARGGWEWDGAVDAFARYAKRAGAAFGDLVDYWCTLNEPNVYVAKGYLSAEWPPGVRDAARALRAYGQLLKGHALAAQALRALDRFSAGRGPATRIGLAYNVRVFDPARHWNPLDRLAARYSDEFYNRSLPEAVASGRIRLRIPTRARLDEPYPALQGTLDWLGLNYYTRDRVHGHLFGAMPLTREPVPAARATDLGWEIHPEGLLELLHRMSQYGWPLIVTEIGMADRGGERRPGFLRQHLYAVDRALAEGVDARGVIVWSLTDNFEWSHGYDGRFGLYGIDFTDPELARRPTPAVQLFRETARSLKGR